MDPKQIRIQTAKKALADVEEKQKKNKQKTKQKTQSSNDWIANMYHRGTGWTGD